MIKIIALVVVIGAVSGWLLLNRDRPSADAPQKSSGKQYVALGDSYTIGEGVRESDRWPNQLKNRLSEYNLNIVANPSRTGYTTQDLIDKELPVLNGKSADLITVQIGVNDYYQGVRVEEFATNLNYILDEIKRVQPAAAVLLVTIPDYGSTPFGSQSGKPEVIAAGIQEFNQVIGKIGLERGVPVADIFAISQTSVAQNKIAPDGLHPSKEQYTDWLQAIEPAVTTLLRD